MNYYTIALVIIIFILTMVLLLKRQKSVIKKSASQKKNEIFNLYKQEMNQIITKYESNSIELKEQKIILIKKVNKELNQNIFFTKDDIKRVIYELTKM